MKFLKSLGRGLNSFFLKISLLLLAISGSFLLVFGTPAALKRSVASSNLYSSFTDTVIQNTRKEVGQESSLPLERPEIQAAIKSAISPQFLQTSTEEILDSTYRWLDGKTPKPDFRIDLAPVKQNLANNLADHAVTRAKGLPACSLAQIRQLQASKIDPLNVPCLPPGLNPETLRAQVVSDIFNNGDFIKESVISVDNFQKDHNGKTPFDDLKQAPKVFKWLKIVPYVAGGIVLFSSVALVLLYDRRRRGLRAVGIILLANGIFLLISTLILSYFLADANKPSGKLTQITDGNAFEANAIDIVRSLTDAVNMNLYKFCAAYILLGAIILVALKLTGPKNPKSADYQHEAEAHITPVEPGSTTELPPPAHHPKPTGAIEPQVPQKKSK